MTKTITKKSDKAELPLSTQTEKPKEESVKVDFNQEEGTAKVDLVNGTTLTLKEPKAKSFIYLASRMETAPDWQKSATMSVYLLSHFMITEVSKKGQKLPIPSFDEFMDMLEDDDIASVGAAFACFPDVFKRVQKLFPSGNSAGS